MIWQCLFNTDEDSKNCSYIVSGAFILISTCKFTMFDYSKDVIVQAFDLKNCRLHYSGNNQLFKVDIDSTSLPAKDTELFYCNVARLLFASKKSRPDIQACVASLFAREELPMKYYKDIH